MQCHGKGIKCGDDSEVRQDEREVGRGKEEIGEEKKKNP